MCCPEKPLIKHIGGRFVENIIPENRSNILYLCGVGCL